MREGEKNDHLAWSAEIALSVGKCALVASSRGGEGDPVLCWGGGALCTCPSRCWG